MKYKERIINMGIRFERLLNEGGGTVNTQGKVAEFGGYGYMVGGHVKDQIKPTPVLFEYRPIAYLIKEKQYFQLGKVYDSLFTALKYMREDGEGYYIGFWLEDGFIHGDVSRHYIHLSKAMEEGAKRKQKTIWSFREQKVIYVIPNPK